MARELHRLSSVAVRNAKSGMHCDGGGLYLQATEAADKTISKSWLFRFATGRIVTSAAGKPRAEEKQMGLGPLDAVSLEEARKVAAECRHLRKQGIDPIAARKAARAETAIEAAKAMTFAQCTDAYMVAHRAGWRSRVHARQWKASMATYATPVFGKLPVNAVDLWMVLKVLEPIWTTKPVTAGRIRGRIECVLDWAAARGYRKGENPARWRGHLDKLLPAGSKVRKVKHYPSLPYDELAAFLASLREQEGTAARALEFTILTAARSNETVGAMWPEIEMTGKAWTLDATRMKGEREHRVPLSAPALAILLRMAEVREGEHVFPGSRNVKLAKSGMSKLLVRMNDRRTAAGLPRWTDPKRGNKDIVPHGFRSTFRSWAAECTNFPREIAEAAIAHLVGDDTERAYQRGDLFEKRRRLMAAWAEFCAKSAATGKVLPLRA